MALRKSTKNIFRFVLAPLTIVALLVGSYVYWPFENNGITPTAKAAWYDNSWNYRIKLSVDPSKVANGTTTQTFTSSGTFTVPTGITKVSVLVVAGGGGGGGNGGGGGGAGGVVASTTYYTTPGASLTVTVGAGGSGTFNAAPSGGSGSNSVFGTITATGGGGGASRDSGGAASSGGSGGGGGGAISSPQYTAGSGTAGQGNNGGAGTGAGGDLSCDSAGGGGGGAGGTGTAGAADVGGNGGAGASNSFTGTAATYAGGGGGGVTCSTNTRGTGGSGGGGTGGNSSNAATAGTANTGGGGGGGGPSATGGAGGSGIVVVSYQGGPANFPVYVNLAHLPTPVWSNLRSDCGDIRITTSDQTTEVPRELVSCDNSGHTGELWFKAPTLSSDPAATSTFYIYYGNASQGDYATSATYGAQNVWSNGYVDANHMDGADAATTFTDSTARAHTVTGNDNAQIDTAQSQLGRSSVLFDGTSDYLNLDGSSDFAFGTGDFAIKLWVRLNTTGITQVLYDGRPAGTASGSYPDLYISSGNVLKYDTPGTNRITGTSALTTGIWYYIVLTRASGSTRLFLNGVQEGSTYSDSTTYVNGTSRPTVGTEGNVPTNNELNGWIDDIHVATTSRSTAWITTEYNNQSSPGTFYYIGEPLKTTYLTSGTSWTVPSDWNSSNNTIEVIGGGGGGGGPNGTTAGGGGGGGYSKISNLTLTPGASVTYAVGAAGNAGTSGNAGTAGGNSYFCNSTSNCASISGTAVVVGATGGSGGPSATGFGAGGGGGPVFVASTTYSGGAGGISRSGNNGGNGGGGAGGPLGTGGAGGSNTTNGGGGGGGNGGGSAGANQTANGGIGGNNAGGSGSGAIPGGAGSNGGGGGGGNGTSGSGGAVTGGVGGAGIEWDATHGSGGGGGGGANLSNGSTGTGGTGALYGGGGGGGGANTSTGGNGAQGIVVIIYAPASGGVSNSSSAPTPSTMSFVTAPAGASPSSVSMTAITATDTGGGVDTQTQLTGLVEYFFSLSACGGSDDGTGAASSTWQTSTSYTNSGLQVNKCYGYKVQARDGLGNYNATSTASTTYSLANTPGVPTLGTPAATTLTITNAENSNPASNPTTKFAASVTATSPTDSTWLGKYTDASGNPTATETWLSDAQLDSLVLNGLTNGTQYTVQVAARNESLVKTASSTGASATTLVIPTTPGTPTYSNVAATSMTVSWTAATGADTYKLERCTGSYNCTPSQVASGIAATSYGDSGLVGNTTYYYRVRGTGTGGDGAYSATSSQLTLPASPSPPTYTNITDTALTVNWSAPAGGATTYKLERCAGEGCTDFAEIASGLAVTYYDDSGLTPNTNYRYRVRGTNTAGDGGYSGITNSYIYNPPPGSIRLKGDIRIKGGTGLQ